MAARWACWVTEPDGTLVQFGVRPLLPDEIGRQLRRSDGLLTS